MSAKRRMMVVAVVGFVVAAGVVGQAFARQKPRVAKFKAAKASNAFAYDLYKQLASQKGNLVFSPYSVSTALTMTAAGAGGDTKRQMARMLHLGSDDAAVHQSFAQSLAGLNLRGKQTGVQLDILNAIWCDKSYPLKQPYVELLKSSYRAKGENVDFRGDAEAAREKINAWVSKGTQSKIPELFAKGSIDAATRLVLTNAVYFKGEWAERFDPRRTRPMKFKLGVGEEVEVPFMRRDEKARYCNMSMFQALDLPYQGKKLSMLILLPREGKEISAVEAALSPKTLETTIKRLAEHRVQVALPKFKLDAAFDLPESLKKLGMVEAFDRQKADFSGMNNRKDLYVTAVVHKATIVVNEEGAEAAASTGVAMGLKAAPAIVSIFRADRPFLFMIRDNQSGAILFMGRVTDPR